MHTVRRLYVYLVTLISLELVVWGLVNLLQTSLSATPGAASNLLASGLSLVLVGLPIFLLHGWIAQREALRDPEEQTSRVRALYYYGARLALLGPVIFQLYDLIRDPLQKLLGVSASNTTTPGSTPLDRIIAIAINLIAWIVMERLLRADWRFNPLAESLVEVRRLSRYVWMLFGLGLAIAGVLQVLQFLLYPAIAQTFTRPAGQLQLANGLALIVVGVPLWVYCWGIVQRTWNLPGERPSLLRMVVLYFLALAGVLVVLFTLQSVLAIVLQTLLGEKTALIDLLEKINQPLSAAIPLGVVWLYFSRHIRLEWAAESDDLRRAGLRRLYFYLLALAGNAAVFAGVWQVLGTLVEILVQNPIWGVGLRVELAGGLAWLAVGLPFWLVNWPPMQTEARRTQDAGDHARRSVVRKSYLYLVVFLSVVGIMSAAGFLFYRLINAGLGNPGENLVLDSWQQVRTMLVVAVWLMYHLSVLRVDGRLALRSLGERQAAFPIMVLQFGQDPFFSELSLAFQRQAPLLPVSFHVLETGLPGLEPHSVRALVLPAVLALDPPAGLRPWLETFSGVRIVVPLPAEGWVWAGQPGRSSVELARSTALSVRQLSEGQTLRQAAPTNPWAIAGFVLGGLFAILLAIILFMTLFSGLN
jgi:hypothetical protein